MSITYSTSDWHLVLRNVHRDDVGHAAELVAFDASAIACTWVQNNHRRGFRSGTFLSFLFHFGLVMLFDIVDATVINSLLLGWRRIIGFLGLLILEYKIEFNSVFRYDHALGQ